MKNENIIYHGDVLEVLKRLPDNLVNAVITSPPYWGLRDYGVEGQLGLEKTPEEYVEKMVKVFREVRRVLRDDGTLWLNIGDSYAAGGNGGGTAKQESNRGTRALKGKRKMAPSGLKPKDLVGIPWMLAFALRADGWYLRQDIIWSKPNPMPESVEDRCTKAHEYIFLMAKSRKYFYNADAIKTPIKDASIARLAQDIEAQEGSHRVPGKTNGAMKAVMKMPSGWANSPNYREGMPEAPKRKAFDSSMAAGGSKIGAHKGYFDAEGNLLVGSTANKKSVWEVVTMPFAEAHFATFPEALIAPMIRAGSPDKGLILDPFMGAGTTAVVCKKLNRKFLGIELNLEYIKIAEDRIKGTPQAML